MHKKHLSFYGLKWNPFSPNVPVEALYPSARIDSFCWRVENALIREGGFALITGEPGTVKSVTLRMLAGRLNQLRDVTVGVIGLPSGRIPDFYRQMGDLFGIELSPHNRWAGFKKLRERWQAHVESSLFHPVLLIDEAQEVPVGVLNELRLLSSANFDSSNYLSVVLAGDNRLNHKLRLEELIPLGSRIRTRLTMEHAGKEELMLCLKHLLKSAGNSVLMTDALMQTLCEHAVGNYRILIGMAADLLAKAAEDNLTELDEKLYFACYDHVPPLPKASAQE
jgi:type II secretory pathway predicted ATPase ExeA